MTAGEVSIVGLGASTPVGRTVWASAAAARAGVSGFADHPFMIDTAGEPMRVARAPWLDPALEGAGRLCALLLPAIDEALGPDARRRLRGRRLGLAIGLPPPRPGRPADLAVDVSRRLAAHYASLGPRVATFECGHAAGHVALDGAVRSLSASSTDVCVVAGADSYLAPDTLEWLEACEQIHGAGPLNNAWGFIPGEAASAMCVTRLEVAERLELENLGDVAGIGIATESNLIKTDRVCIGEGLTAAVRGALASLDPAAQIGNVFCDLNGETYRADEYGFTAIRAGERLRSATDFIAPADVWGDIGAAGMPLHVSLAIISHRKRYGRGALSLVWASSETGERGAVVIRAAAPAS